ncbi:MAG: glucose PTS transporter subunit IIA [Eubacteriales bacterium]|jgi:glucose-specific phosphotransferase system IIA component
MKDRIFGVLQRVGRSFMLPIALLPVAGLFLGIGGSFTNETMLETYGLLNLMGPGTVANGILTVVNAAGSIVFNNLALIFAMGVAIGMAKKEKEVAALAGAIAFFIMHAAIGAMLTVFGEPDMSGATAEVCGIHSLQMGVFGGILVGLGVAALHNRFYRIELPQVLSFFAGTRFVPIISAIVYLFVGIAMYFVWPLIQSGIYAIGGVVMASGYVGTWIYGIMERALIPFGLHHVFYLPFWQTAVGGTAMVGGQLVEGAQNIFFAELATPGIEHFSVEATRFMSGKFPLMIFGLPGAALAMYHCAKPENRKAVGGLLLSAAITSMLTGITEPLEFTFLFVAVPLYAIHCVLAGASYMLMHMLGVGVGMTFSGGIIDMVLFGVMQSNAKTSWIWIVVVGIVYFIVYYFLFRWMILHFNYATPGRENAENKLYTRQDFNEKNAAAQTSGTTASDPLSAQITLGLGGVENISDVDCCITRLRITVNDPDKVSDTVLEQTGAKGVVRKGNGVQIVYGPRVAVIKSNLEEFLSTPEAHNLTPAMAAAEATPTQQEETPAPSAEAQGVTLLSPITGRIVPLEEVQDGVFSDGMMGPGVAIEPTVGEVYAPCDCTVSLIPDTLHAVGLTTTDGKELLIHVGIDTVNLKGECFQVLVKEGDQLKAGDLITRFDMAGIQAAGYRIVTPVVIPDAQDLQIVPELHSSIKTGDILMQIQ